MRIYVALQMVDTIGDSLTGVKDAKVTYKLAVTSQVGCSGHA